MENSVAVYNCPGKKCWRKKLCEILPQKCTVYHGFSGKQNQRDGLKH